MTDWCVWKIGPYGRRYRAEETATYERDFSMEPLVRKGLTNRQAFVLAQCLREGVPIYCSDLLPEEGQRVRFWLTIDEIGERRIWTAHGKFIGGCFFISFYRAVTTPPLCDSDPFHNSVYAWEPEPPAPPLPPEPGK